jgi:hypothetical protein
VSRTALQPDTNNIWQNATAESEVPYLLQPLQPAWSNYVTPLPLVILQFGVKFQGPPSKDELAENAGKNVVAECHTAHSAYLACDGRQSCGSEVNALSLGPIETLQLSTTNQISVAKSEKNSRFDFREQIGGNITLNKTQTGELVRAEVIDDLNGAFRGRATEPSLTSLS